MARPVSVALSAAVLLAAAAAAPAQLGPLTNGSLDPFNRNNSLGGSIQTPFVKPTLPSRPADSGSQLAVQSYQLDADGNFVEVSPYGSRTATGKRGKLLRDAKTGKAFWEYTSGGQRYATFAAPKWQAVLDAQERSEQAARPVARTLFRIQSSQFQAYAGGKWVEKGDSGATSTFTETGRTDEYIELYDAGRRLHVRLYADRGLFYDTTNRRWTPWSGSQGKWAK